MNLLFDSGSQGCVVKSKFVKQYQFIKGSSKEEWITKAGTFMTDGQARISFTMDEFDPHRVVTWDMHVYDSNDEEDQFDMIIGEDLMRELGIKLDYKLGSITWDGLTRPMRSVHTSEKTINELREESRQSQSLKESLADQEKALDITSTPINVRKVVKEAKHLDIYQRNKLKKLLTKYKSIFDGTLGTMSGGQYHINLKDDTPRSLQKRCFPIAKCHEKKFKKELDRLEKLNVICKLYGDETQDKFAFPAFTIPKRNTDEVRFVSDFRELNKWVVRSPYLVPPIRDTLNKMEGFQYATTIDISMGYWHIELDLESQRKCVITTPWGRYAYTRLPMGLSSSADIFQERMS